VLDAVQPRQVVRQRGIDARLDDGRRRARQRGYGGQCAEVHALGQRLQARALLEHPLVEVSRQQRAAVQRERLLAQASAHRGLELEHIAADGARCDAHRGAVSHDHRHVFVRWLEQALERRQHLPKSVAAHLDRDLRPKQVDQLLARVRSLGRQRQARQQQGDGAARPVRQHRAAPIAGLDVTQQAHTPALAGAARR
jgi:hypothetical protein